MFSDATARHNRAIAALCAVAADPTATADRAASAALDVMRFDVADYGWRGFQAHGRGLVLLDLRPEADARLSYFPRDVVRDIYCDRVGPFTPLVRALDDYQPPGELIAAVFSRALVRAYRLDYFAHGQGDAPLVPFIDVMR